MKKKAEMGRIWGIGWEVGLKMAITVSTKITRSRNEMLTSGEKSENLKM
jgi:hypothetical protein